MFKYMCLIDDNYIISEFLKDNKINRYRVERATTEELEYLKNRYNDSESLYETIKRILWNCEEHPKCPICNKPLKMTRGKKRHWQKYCSQSCKSKDFANILERKYGIRTTLRLPENIEKTKNTIMERYGVENTLQIPEVREKIKKTNKQKYGYEYVSQSPIIKEKVKQTCLEKFGSEFYLTSNDCKQKTIEKFGVDNFRKTEKCKQLVSEYIKDHKEEWYEKLKNGLISRYGVDNPMKISEVVNKVKQTCLEKYGTNTWSQCSEAHLILSNILSSPEIRNKINNTKRKNKSFNKSQTEDKSYMLLKEKFGEVQRNKRTSLYPFNCDFYIPSLDLYIECNYHWTHGGHPFNEDNELDLELLNKWKSKNTKYYNGAIYTWTKRDVNKRNIAKENNLNYFEFWNIKDLENWIKNGNLT